AGECGSPPESTATAGLLLSANSTRCLLIGAITMGLRNHGIAEGDTAQPALGTSCPGGKMMNIAKQPLIAQQGDWRRIDREPPTAHGYVIELWAHREVAKVLIRRDLIVRFRQTTFGLAWLLFKPLSMMFVMTFAFGYLAGFADSHRA